jgi:hypothetical protein
MTDKQDINTICDLCISKGLPLRIGTNKIVYCMIEEPLKHLEGVYRVKAYARDDDIMRSIYHCTYNFKVNK